MTAKLSLEQQFSLRSFEAQVRQLTPAETKNLCVVLYEQSLVKDALYRELLKGAMGLGGES